MGGDFAPDMVIEGIDRARRKCPGIEYIIFGQSDRVQPLLDKFPDLKKVSQFIHAPDVVRSEDKPSAVLRSARNSSMRMAINAVAEGKAHCVVSAGNTGALMAMAKMVLKVLPGINRPALAGIFPTIADHDLVMLDLGANVDCDSHNLVQFAIMGSVFAKILLKKSDPLVGILNVGSEELKGNDTVRQAAAELREIPFPGRFYGFVEGNDIGKGTVDVIVTDGFTGNIALKTVEGTAMMVKTFFKRAMTSSVFSKLGALLCMRSFKNLQKRIDPRRYNGGMFLGLNGICVKSHGGTDAYGFSSTIWFAHQMAINNYNDTVRRELESIDADFERH